MSYIGHNQSPIVDKTLQKKYSLSHARVALYWAFLNLLLMIITYLELTCYQIVQQYINIGDNFIWYIECALTAVFGINTVVDFLQYLTPTLTASSIELSPRQKRLLGITDADSGFRTTSPIKKKSTSPDGSLLFSPSSFTNVSSLTGSSTPISNSPFSPNMPAHLTPPSGGSRNRSLSPPSGGSLNRSLSPHQARSSPPQHYNLSNSFRGSAHSGSFLHSSSSFLEQSQSLGASHHSSFSASFNRSATSPLSPSSTLSPLFRDSLDTSGLRSRLHNVSTSRPSPMRAEDCITDLKTLDSYLKEQDEKEYRSHLGSGETSPGSGPSFWNYNRSLTDYTPVLRKYQYQIACRSPQSAKSADNDPDDPATFRGEEIWMKVGVFREDVEHWVENFRKWLSQTIMVRLVKEINKINNTLVRQGSDDMQIGDVSISILKQLAITKGAQLPTLNALLPYLEVSTNQEYLIMRIKELGSGGCMSDFKWNGGAEFKSKPWGEHLPTDSVIVMHMFCTYLDSRLPPHPKYPDGKTFTSQHFMKTPDKPDMTKQDNMLLYQSKMNPPHFKVILSDDTWDLPKGRNNLFHSILLFLHHIKSKQHGMLGRINLGLSGINVLWVLDKKL